MKNYVLIYYNNGVETTCPRRKQSSLGWLVRSLGDKIVDAAIRLHLVAKPVEKSGVTTIGIASHWLPIVKANSLDEAVELAKGCPVLDEPDGAVRVHETLPSNNKLSA